jgi:hypothetical protein
VSATNASTLSGGGGQTCQIERNASDEDAFIGFGRRVQAFAFQSRQDEAVDRVPCPGFGIRGRKHGRDPGPFGWDERPERLPLRTLGNPLPDQFGLMRGEMLLARSLWRHLITVGRGDPADDFTLFRMTWHDDPAWTIRSVEAQSCLAMRGVGTVTHKTVVGKDRTDVAIEFDGLTRGAGHSGGQ